MNKCGIIETATGDLLRSGYCDFVNDGSFNAGTETQRTDVPEIAPVRHVGAPGTFKRWDGSAWIDIAQPVV